MWAPLLPGADLYGSGVRSLLFLLIPQSYLPQSYLPQYGSCMDTFACRVCTLAKETHEMRSLYGKPTKICRKCDGKQRGERYRKTPRSRGRQDRINAKIRNQASDGSRVAYFIYRWSRKSDKKKGRQNDLTRDFIEKSIANGCSYCGELHLKMTLDRKDNSLGHLQNNVVPACIRCNYFRGDVPFAAWVHVAPAVKEAVELGLFSNWTGQHRTSPKNDVLALSAHEARSSSTISSRSSFFQRVLPIWTSSGIHGTLDSGAKSPTTNPSWTEQESVFPDFERTFSNECSSRIETTAFPFFRARRANISTFFRSCFFNPVLVGD